MNREDSAAVIEDEVLVVGGGLAGLIAALLLHRGGFGVMLVDARSPAPEAAAHLDGRTTALLRGSLKVLEACDIWPGLKAEAGALWRMRLCEDGAGGPRSIEFDAAEVGAEPFGYNIANARLRQVLLAQVQTRGISLIAPAKIDKLRFAAEGVEARLEDGRILRARLVIGADGRASPSRRAARIHARRTMTGQVALAASFRHAQPHEDVSTEFHRSHGPLVLVPLPGRASSFVWVEEIQEAGRLAQLSEADFAQALESASQGLLGEVEEVGPRFRYPVGVLHADRMVAPRLALVGEAVHALPPIGAQGLNLSLTDVATLVELLVDARRAGREWDAPDVLVAYERRRRRDVSARVLAVEALNRSVAQPDGGLRALRGLGLSLVDRVRPLKRALMQQGMTPLGPVPRLLRGEPL